MIPFLLLLSGFVLGALLVKLRYRKASRALATKTEALTREFIQGLKEPLENVAEQPTEQPKDGRYFSTTIYTYNGKTQSLKDHAAERGISYGTLADRLACGMSPEEAITTPLQRQAEQVEWNGKIQSVTEHAKELGLDAPLCAARHRRGWSLTRVFSLPKDTSRRKEQVEWDGRKVFLADLCKAHGIDVGTYRYRRKRGDTMEEALNLPIYRKPDGWASKTAIQSKETLDTDFIQEMKKEQKKQ